MIDLHLHTTASDGALAPSELVERARAARLTVIAITDHDTTAGACAARGPARDAGLEFVPGIEISAVDDGCDVHMLGYFIDPESPVLAAFLERQRAERRRRVSEIGARLAALGCSVDVTAILESAAGGRTIGRPQLADALVRAGYVADRDEAFSRYLGHGAPAFLPRRGAEPADGIDVVPEAGGRGSMAHPGVTGRDDLIAPLVARGLDAIEVRHSDHDEATEARYRAMAARLGIVVTGGSDYHGETGRRAASLGLVVMPPADFEALRHAAGRSRARQ